MTDGRCRFGPRAKREMVARLLAGEQARRIARSLGCSPTTVTTTRDRWLEGSEAGRASGGGVRAAAADPAVVSVGADRGRGAGDPRCPRPDELGTDAPDLVDRPASLDLLEGAAPPRRQPPAAQRAPAEHAPL